MNFLHEVLRQHAIERPQKPAFRFEQKELDFATLDARSTRLAAFLQSKGLKKGDRVGLYLHRGLEVPLSLYATFKAGGAFVPLDPFPPLERIAHLIRDTDMNIIITHAPLAKKAREICALVGRDVDIIGLEENPWEVALSFAGELETPDLVDEDLAYIIFTSGSTGRPKGIMHSHRSGIAFARKCRAMIDLAESDVMAALSPLIFDMALNEYFGGPLVGATVVIVPDGLVRFPASLGQHLVDEQVNIYCSVPSLLIQFLRAEPERFDLTRIRWIITGGEPLAPKTLAHAFAVMPNAAYANFYGPAETNTCVWHVMKAGDESGLSSLPIGHVAPGGSARIVDHAGDVVSGGEGGELLIRSATVMQSYWRDAEKSARAFHFAQSAGGQNEVWLRTEDHVRVNDAGFLEYLGRQDRLIKTRGYRVELDEVEAALAAVPCVIEAGAFLLTDKTGQSLIGAAVTMAPGAALTEAELTKTLLKTLPPYAVPSEIRIIATFPRTQSGKIARQELADQFKTDARGEYA